ncbi:MAG: hypothetical protein IM473_17620 [Microcystis sp. M015S2]|jgi:hypothetical protein|uniref:Uncharacterized protein n=8 Tax=Microcystis TaxID=1125 RepID=A0A0F6RL28_MICAE|nr:MULTISPECIES: hypothetical protein [Microcystis]MCA2647932.1 hypothetical protein [Microcystis sp. M069S2]MCA2653152.1 hypothetical protein [Microcystis sp. M061S2]MCA2660587.1 hypothetical protein [Microcystis sp. M049S2]MCA2665293.1 hypothetical protein [Microcystis sp. M064S2]MCA2676158.1 hypothetical protein [Microcystis sp. M054S2]MCA2744154.1 hypothetical protein [Microcystis sp. M015S2]MCA2797905.1 hypothetical protein [Microcystis sp. M100S2]MCA2816803.1 hypothetical protein [Mic
MNIYQKTLVIQDPNQLVLSDLPFQKGQQVEVMIIAKNYDREALANKLRDFFKEVQALHADNPLTEEEIEAEIEDYRRGK